MTQQFELGNILDNNEFLYPPKNIDRAFIYNCPKLSFKSIVGWINSVLLMLFSNEKEQTIATCNNVNESHRHSDQQKKTDLKEERAYDSIYIKFKNRKN